MTPIEHYWPHDLLAKAMPERYGHLMKDDDRPITNPHLVEALSPPMRPVGLPTSRQPISEAKLRDAKRRANWTIPLEHYYPPDTRAEAFPDRYRSTEADDAIRDVVEGARRKRSKADLYLPPSRTATPSQGATGMAQASPTAPPRYTVEPVGGGCAVIRPQFGAGIRFRERKGA